MSLTQTPEYRKRTKHIDISYHFVREKVASGEITVIYTPTDDMTADVLTKALPLIKHEKHVQAMKLLPLCLTKKPKRSVLMKPLGVPAFSRRSGFLSAFNL
jgi:hypothetical protein